MSALPRGQDIFNAAFIVVLVSLLVQGWTIRPMARQLGLIIPPTIGPVEKVELELPGTAQPRARRLSRRGRQPGRARRAHPALGAPVARRAQGPVDAPAISPAASRPDDHVYLFTAPRNIRLLDRLFASPARVEEDDKDFFGEFYIDTSHTLGELAQAYGVEPPGDPATPIGVYMLERLGGQAEVGDRVAIGFLELIVRDTDESGAVTAAGLALAPEPAPGPAAWPVLSGIVDFAAIVRTPARRLRRPLATSRALEGDAARRRAPAARDAVRRLLPVPTACGRTGTAPARRRATSAPNRAAGAGSCQARRSARAAAARAAPRLRPPTAWRGDCRG